MRWPTGLLPCDGFRSSPVGRDGGGELLDRENEVRAPLGPLLDDEPPPNEEERGDESDPGRLPDPDGELPP